MFKTLVDTVSIRYDFVGFLTVVSPRIVGNSASRNIVEQFSTTNPLLHIKKASINNLMDS